MKLKKINIVIAFINKRLMLLIYFIINLLEGSIKCI